MAVTTCISDSMRGLLARFTHRVHNGADYWELLTTGNTEHVASAIVNEAEKLVYPDAVSTVDLVCDRWRYGWELQFKAYTTRRPVLVDRKGDHGVVFRLEPMYLPVTLETADQLLELSMVIRSVATMNGQTVELMQPKRVLTGHSGLWELM